MPESKCSIIWLRHVKGHRSHVDGPVTEHTWEILSMKKAMMNLTYWNKLPKFILTTDMQISALMYSRSNDDLWCRSTGTGKASFWDNSSEDRHKLKSSIDAKSRRGKSDEEQNIYTISKYLFTNYLIMAKWETIYYKMEKLLNTLASNQNEHTGSG